MYAKHLALMAFWAALSAACGGSKPPAESPADSEAAEEKPAESDAPAAEGKASAESGADASAIPTDCYKPSGLCVPSPKFVRKLCNNRFPSIALYLFGNSKWTHGYLTRKTEAWNASGGASAGGYLEFDEEVLLLAERKADTGGMQVSGAGAGYDAIRWDGSCVTLSGEELTRDKPPQPKTPRIEWRFLDDNVQEALRKDDKVNAGYLERRKECKGASTGDVSAKCVKADAQLSDAIINFVRHGGSLPVPSTLP
ncbi:MAG TPA: hypothetical protein VG937_05640 [Polyangiaceae bacterium]|nr:hypothetical protein [Polyangiaceae bacterium]